MSQLSPVVNVRDMEFAPTLSRSLWAARLSSRFRQLEPDPPHGFDVASIRVRLGQLVQQGLALLALLPIWLYRGRQGYHARWFQHFGYAFYPLHMLVLYAIYQLVTA